MGVCWLENIREVCMYEEVIDRRGRWWKEGGGLGLPKGLKKELIRGIIVGNAYIYVTYIYAYMCVCMYV